MHSYFLIMQTLNSSWDSEIPYRKFTYVNVYKCTIPIPSTIPSTNVQFQG